jgi:hypothetical protein
MMLDPVKTKPVLDPGKTKIDTECWMLDKNKSAVCSKQQAETMIRPVEDPPPILLTAYCPTACCIYHICFHNESADQSDHGR